MTLTYRVGLGGSGTVDLGDVVFLGDMPGFTERAGGDQTGGGGAGMSGVTIQDPAGTLNLTGLNKFAVEESACTSNVRIFTGISTERGISRGEYTTGAGRVWDVGVQDSNGYLHLRVIRDANHGNRPAETDAQRVAWLLAEVLNAGHVINGTGGLFGANGPTAGVLASPRQMDATDYRNQHADDVLADIAAPRNRRFFTYWDPTLEAVCLFYGLSSENLGDSTLRISNVASDADAVTFAPFQDASLTRDPTDVFGGINYTYRHGTIYREDPDTIASFLDRSVGVENDRVGLATTASAFVDDLLDKASTERDTVTCTIRVPRAQVNLVIAGQRISVKFSHLPALTSFTWRYVMSRTVWQEVANAEFYYVTLELSDKIGGGLSGGGGTAVPFVPSSGNITFRQAGEGTDSGQALLPAAPLAGSLILMQLQTSDSSIPTPTGFTDLFGATIKTTAAPSAPHGFRLWYRVAQTGDTATYLVPGASFTYTIAEFTGGPTWAIITSDYAIEQGAGASDHPQITLSPVTHAGQVLVVGAFIHNNTLEANFAPDSGWVTTVTEQFVTTVDIGMVHVIEPNAGSYTPGVSTAPFLGGYGAGAVAFSAAILAPEVGQLTTESLTGTTAGADYTLNYPYATGSLKVTVNGAAVTATEVDPTAGTLELGFDATGKTVVVSYQIDSATTTGSTNPQPTTSSSLPSSGAPTDGTYLVTTAHAGLSAEVVVGATPGGELGGTWAAPTVDATHAGSAHLALGSSGSTAAAGNHTHTGLGTGPILISDTPSTPIVFADLLQNEAQNDLVYADT